MYDIVLDNGTAGRDLLKLLNEAKTRIAFTIWRSFGPDDNKFSKKFCQALKDAKERGVTIHCLVNNCLLLDKECFHKHYRKLVIPCHSSIPCHAKMFVVDDIYINSDRSISSYYYGYDKGHLLGCDLHIKDKFIADNVHKFITKGGIHEENSYVKIHSGENTLYIGMIYNVIKKIIKENKCKIMCYTFFPSYEIVNAVSENKSKVISVNFENRDLSFLSSVTDFLTTKNHRYTNNHLHMKLIITDSFVAQGSYSLDLVGEVWDQEQILVSTNKELIEVFTALYDYYYCNDVEKPSISLNPLAIPVLNFCRLAIHNVRCTDF